MNALNTISQALVSRTTTGVVLLGYSTCVGHLLVHKVTDFEHPFLCHLPMIVLNMGTATALSKATARAGIPPLVEVVLVTGTWLGVARHYDFVDENNETVKRIFKASAILGKLGFLFISAISQLKCIEKIAVKYHIKAPKAFNFLPFNLLVLTGLMAANCCALSLIDSLARENITRRNTLFT